MWRGTLHFSHMNIDFRFLLLSRVHWRQLQPLALLLSSMLTIQCSRPSNLRLEETWLILFLMGGLLCVSNISITIKSILIKSRKGLFWPVTDWHSCQALTVLTLMLHV